MLRRRLAGPVAGALLALAAAAPASAAPTSITDCSEANVKALVVAGGEYRFACTPADPITFSEPVVVRNLVLDAAGRDVRFSHYAERLFRVTGRLELIGVDVTGYSRTQYTGTAGVHGAVGTGYSWTNPDPRPGGHGADGTKGTEGSSQQGGCFYVEPGALLELSFLTVERCGAIGTNAGFRSGSGGNGGQGGRGTFGTDGRDERSGVAAGDGGPGGVGGAGGNAGRPADGADGGTGEGGAIYSRGTLKINGVDFLDNTAVGGRAGTGGHGGNGGMGGKGGSGGRGGAGWYGPHARGGAGGASGAGGLPTRGADGGDGGDARGGAIYADGPTTIANSRFLRNSAIGGFGEEGGTGGQGGEGEYGPGGFGQTRDLDGPDGAAFPGGVGGGGGDQGDGGDARGGAVYFAGTPPPITGTISDANTVTAGLVRSDCDPPDDYRGCAFGGWGGYTNHRTCAYPTYTGCVRAASGPVGKQGKAGEASDPDIVSTPAEAPFTATAVGPPGEWKFTSTLELPAEFLPIKHAWAFGDGKTDDDHAFTYHTYEKPGSFEVVHTVTDFERRTYRSKKTVEVAAPELGVSITPDPDALTGGRLPLNRDVDVVVRVAASCTGVGGLKGLGFDDGVVLKGSSDTQLRLTGFTAPSGTFDLARCSNREFTGQIRALTRGDATLRTRVTGKDAADRAVERAATEPVKLGEDLIVTVVPTPAELQLAVDETADPPRPVAKPVKLAVAVKNVSGQTVRNGKLSLAPAVRGNTARNAAAPFPLQLVQLDDPLTPLTNTTAKDLALPELTNGTTKTLTFTADAKDKAIVDVTAIARGTAVAAGQLPARDVSGNGKGAVRIGQPKLLALTAKGRLSGAARAGEPWAYSGHIENLSPDEDVTVLIRADRRGNVIEGQLDVLGDPDACGCGVFRRLTPGEKLPIYGVLRGRPDGAGTGSVELKVTGRRHTYDANGAEVAVPVTPAEVVTAPGAERRTVEFFLFDPVVPPISVGGVAWLVSDNAARAFGDRVTGAQASAAAALASAQTFAETPKSVYLQWALTIIKEEAPEALARAKADMVNTLMAFDDQLDSGEALAIAANAYTTGYVESKKAWDDATWQELSAGTGKLLGSNAPELALEAILPGIGACKLFKYGGKTAMLRYAEKLGASRAGRLLAKGRKGLLPGDAISDLLARKLWGVDGLIDAQLLAYAKSKRVIIAVRDRSPGSIRRLAEGLLPKWEKVKAKNVSQLDIDFLGFHESHLDTAMLKQMPDEATIRSRIAGKDRDTQELVLERWKQRKKEWEGKDRAEMEAYEQGGSIPKPSQEVGLNPTDNGAPQAEGVWVDRKFELARAGKGDLAATTDGLPAYQPRAFDTKTGKLKAMTGDMDPIAVLDENGQIPSLERRLEIYRDLAKMGFQHPESLTWDNPAGRAKYLRDFDLANGDADALLAYHPDGSRRAAYFDSRKSRLEDASKGFMALIGVNLAFDAAGMQEGAVGVIPPAEGSPPLYLTPGGDAGANLSSAPGTRLVRRNLDGSFSEWTREGGWKPYALPGGETLTTVPQSSVRQASAAGQTRIDINEQDALILRPGAQGWFKPGDLVVIDPGGPNEEFVTVAALGSIITTEPLRRTHVSGEMVALVPRAPTAEPPSGAPAPQAPGAPTPTTPRAPTPSTTPARTPGATVPKARAAAPRVTRVKLASRSFKRRSGTKLSFTLDRAATVAVVLKRRAAGRRKGKTCSAKAKSGKRCRVLVAASTRAVRGKAGRTTVAFGKGLRRGSYVAWLAAKGASGVSVSFTVR